MKCLECKHFSGQPGDRYGLCRRYPKNENKSQEDLCGEFTSKIVVVEFVEDAPKRGRKPKNAS